MLYLVRRRLGFTISEWLALPWWHRRVYTEGLTDELERRAAEGGGDDGSMGEVLDDPFADHPGAL